MTAAAPGAEDVAAALARLRREHAGARVLLAEDHPINREIMQELLREPGLVVESAVDGAQAIDAVRCGRFDVVLMDVQMPGIDGLEATRALRRDGIRLPIVAMTAAGGERDLQACREAGMDEVLVKPVLPVILYRMLLRVLPAPSPADPLLDRLAAIDGFDPEVALANVGGQPSALARVLERFADSYRHGVAELAATAAGPAQRMKRRRSAHALRGVAGTLGAISLQDALEAIEHGDDAGLTDAELDALAAVAADALRHLIDGLDLALSAAAPPR